MELQYYNLKELYEKKGKLIKQMKDISAEIQDGTSMSFVKDKQREFDRIDIDLSKLIVDIKVGEREEGIAAGSATPIDGSESGFGNSNPSKIFRGSKEFKALEQYARTGRVDPEARANYFTTTDGEGGYTIPTGVYKDIVMSKQAFGGLISDKNVTWWNTKTGNDVVLPCSDDTGVSGYKIAEKTDLSTSAKNMTFEGTTLKSYKYTSGLVVVTNELLQDSDFDFGAFLFDKLLTRLWRGLNTAFTTGTGSSEPKGIYATSTKGEDATVRGLTRDDLLNLFHSVDPAYRVGDKTQWMFNDSTLKVIKALIIASTYDNSPMWQPGMAVGAPDKIEGIRYTINQDMESIHPTYKPVLFGDFSEFIVRQAGPLRFVRLSERFADLDETGFVLLGRFESNKMAVSATYPWKHLRNATT